MKEAVAWYEAQRLVLGERFLDGIDRVISRVARAMDKAGEAF